MKIVDIASEIYMDAGSPTTTSIPAIAYWVRSKVGTINTLLFEDYRIDCEDGTYEIVDGTRPDGTPCTISKEAVSIIKQLYRIYDYEVQARGLMNALATDSVVKWEDQGTLVMRVNKNEMAKTLINIRKDEIETLKRMVNAYRIKEGKPHQVAGDDTVIGWFEPERLSIYPRAGGGYL